MQYHTVCPNWLLFMYRIKSTYLYRFSTNTILYHFICHRQHFSHKSQATVAAHSFLLPKLNAGKVFIWRRKYPELPGSKDSRKPVCFVNRCFSSNAAIGWSYYSATRDAKRILPLERETHNSSIISQLHQNKSAWLSQMLPSQISTNRSLLLPDTTTGPPKFTDGSFLFVKSSATSTHTAYNLNQIHFYFMKWKLKMIQIFLKLYTDITGIKNKTTCSHHDREIKKKKKVALKKIHYL